MELRQLAQQTVRFESIEPVLKKSRQSQDEITARGCQYDIDAALDITKILRPCMQFSRQWGGPQG